MKRVKLRPATGVIVRNLKFLFVDIPMSWWESTESENYCARCEHLIEFGFGWRSSPNVTPQVLTIGTRHRPGALASIPKR